MSVTNLNEIDKADVLVAGLRKHPNEVKELGITTDAINRLEEAAKSLRQKDAEVDELRRQATLKAHENLELIADLKAQMLTMRKAVKARYPQYEWIIFCLMIRRPPRSTHETAQYREIVSWLLAKWLCTLRSHFAKVQLQLVVAQNVIIRNKKGVPTGTP